MEKQKSHEIRVGIFVAIGLFLSMVVIFLLGGGTNLFERHYRLITRFENTSGLAVGTKVSVMGIPVGVIEDIRFSDDPSDPHPLIKLKVAHKYRNRIREDSQAWVVTQGLLGDKLIQISMGSPGARELRDGETLEVKKGLSIETVAEKGTEALTDLSQSIKKINQMLDDFQEKKGLVHTLLYDSEGAEFIKNLTAMTKEIRYGNGLLHTLVFSKDRTLSENFSSTIANLRKTTDAFKLLAAKIEKGEGSLGGFLNDPTVYQDFKTLLGKANRSKLIKAVIQYTMSKNEKDTLK